MKTALTLMIFFILLLDTITANGVGNTVEKIVDGFSFEFGMDPKEPKADEKVSMSLSVRNATTGKWLEVEDLWMRISKDDKVLFASNNFRIRADSPMFFDYVFKDGGDYLIDFSAKYKNKEIKTDYAVLIKKNSEETFKKIMIFGAIFTIGFFMCKFLHKRRPIKDKV